MQTKRKYCRTCKRKTRHVKDVPQTVGLATHLALLIVSCGLYAVLMPLVIGMDMWNGILAPWHCQVCGAKN